LKICISRLIIQIRRGNYSGAHKALRNDRNYVDVHIDVDYDSEEPLDRSRRAFAYEDDYYTRYAPQNTIGRSRKERFAQYDYPRDRESFARSNRAYQRENNFLHRYVDENEKNLHDIHNGQPRKIKILSKADEIFDRETGEFFPKFMKLWEN